MKKAKNIIILFLLIAGSCTKTSKTDNKLNEISNIDSIIRLDTISIDNPTTLNKFQIERILNFGDTLAKFFNLKAQYSVKNYRIQIDTTYSGDYEKIRFALKTNQYRTNGLISFEIYSFSNVQQATDFFNDLKTQELVLRFGLNKRPNHILLDSNKVFWHHYEHGYGHRMKDLKQIFNTSFNFRPSSNNLDSVSGFTYCKCIQDDANLKGLFGGWKTVKSQQMYKRSEDEFANRVCYDTIPENIDIKFTKDSILINGMSFKHKVRSSIKLPDNSLYWKHLLSHNTSFGSYIYRVDYAENFIEEIEQLKNHKETLIVYDISLSNHCSIYVIKLKTGRAFLIMNERFFEISQRNSYLVFVQIANDCLKKHEEQTEVNR